MEYPQEQALQSNPVLLVGRHRHEEEPDVVHLPLEQAAQAAEVVERSPQVHTGQILGAAALTHEGVAQHGRLRRLLASREVRGGIKPALRLAANLAISAIDAIPFVGDGFEWMIDASKTFKATDFLTPNVSRKAAWMSEFGEFLDVFTLPFGLSVPTHLVETYLQFRHDRKHLAAAFRAGSAILRNKDIVKQ